MLMRPTGGSLSCAHPISWSAASIGNVSAWDSVMARADVVRIGVSAVGGVEPSAATWYSKYARIVSCESAPTPSFS